MTAASHTAGEPLTLAALDIDCAAVTDDLVSQLKSVVGRQLRRRGAVVAVSGGVDSAVTAALCARAFGPGRTLAVLMPESDSADGTPDLSRAVVAALGVDAVYQDITPILTAAGCYAARDDAVKESLPEFAPGWRWKIVLPSVLGHDAYRFFRLVAQSPDGRIADVPLRAEQYSRIIAATNFKQRVRKMLEYYHADRLNYAVVGTPNRLEYDQGFFVKLGDGAADVKPLAHLYKTQVFRLGEFLGLPEEIVRQVPTTDTYSLPQTQEEFYFSLSLEKLDLCLYALNCGLPADAVTEATGMSSEDVTRVFRDIERKRRATRYLHLPPVLLGAVPEVPPPPY